ncbi:MAG: hypothetical protein U0163_13585 [Gemmatimonadaceae bacterium]
MNDRTWRTTSMVLVLSAAACGEPTATVRTGFPATNDQAFAARSWVTLTPDAVAREWPSAANVGEQLHVMGGWTGSTISSDLARVRPSRERRRTDASASVLLAGVQGLSGQPMVISEASSGVPGTTVSVYNPSSNSWTTTTPFPVAAGCGGSGVIAGTLYAPTGCRYSIGPTQDRCTATTHKRTNGRPEPPSDPTTVPRGGGAGGKLYAVGGIQVERPTSGDLTVFWSEQRHVVNQGEYSRPSPWRRSRGLRAQARRVRRNRL